jgi:hypothetical protein
MFDPKPTVHVDKQPSLGPTMIGITYRTGQPTATATAVPEPKQRFPRTEPQPPPVRIQPQAPAPLIQPPPISLSTPGTELAALHALQTQLHNLHVEVAGLRADLTHRSAYMRWQRLKTWAHAQWTVLVRKLKRE